ncbi:MAG: hypothetical protein U1F27_11380 [Turneriella sp.]
MDQRQAEYAEYYKVRMKKYEGNPLYKNSYETEKALYELMATATSEAEYKAKFQQGNLNTKNAIALVKDQETAEKAHWESLQETIKAKGCAAILAVIDSFNDVMTMITETNNIRQKNSLEQSVDGFVDGFYSDFLALENIEVYEKADVPSRWRAEREDSIREMKAEGRKLFEEVTLPRAREWDPDWKWNHDLVWEVRHRRVIPVPDETITRRIPQHKKYLGV